jgi:hypothetical protein
MAVTTAAGVPDGRAKPFGSRGMPDAAIPPPLWVRQLSASPENVAARESPSGSRLA